MINFDFKYYRFKPRTSECFGPRLLTASHFISSNKHKEKQKTDDEIVMKVVINVINIAMEYGE